MITIRKTDTRMKKQLCFFIGALILFFSACNGMKTSENVPNDSQYVVSESKTIESDKYITSNGELKITLVGHGSLMFEYNGKIIHIDPYSKVADYTKLPKADLVLLTHAHSDHLDRMALKDIKKEDTRFVMAKICQDTLGFGEIMKNGDEIVFGSVNIKAVPAYNLVNKEKGGDFYHPKGVGNGYVFEFGDKIVYVAGDTENIPEMHALKNKVDIAFLPKNTPYTMTDEMFVDATKKILPIYLYPYHFSNFNYNKISKALGDTNVKLLVRSMSNN